jgi:hypothetical protein
LEDVKGVVRPVSDTSEAINIHETLSRFRFEGISSPGLSKILSAWQETFSSEWIPLAVVQAAYQGRYKVASVEQILKFWERRGEPRCNFDREFKRMILGLDWEPIVKPIDPMSPAPSRPKSTVSKKSKAFYASSSFPIGLHPEVQEILQSKVSSSDVLEETLQEDPYGPVIARLRELTRMVHS